MRTLLLFNLVSIVLAASVHKTIVIEERLYHPDGFPRRVTAVSEEAVQQDRPFPGPLIRATKGDTVHLTVKNHLRAKTTIHCHGLHMNGNPWMDGAYGITECGIDPGASFTYIFNVTQTGTYWYHSHTATQYADGLLGPLILDYPPDEPDPVQAAFPYEKEHILLFQDWMHESAEDLEMYYKAPYGSFPGFQPKYPWPTVSLLINGHGPFDCQWDDCSWQHGGSICESSPQCIPIRKPFFGTCQPGMHDPDTFECPTGQNVRLRLINGASNLPFRFWIDRHPLTIVARDGTEIEPITVDNITIPVGQRFDAIINCNQDDSYQYAAYLAIEPNCLPHGANLRNISAMAYFNYPNATSVREPEVTPDTPFANDFYFEYKSLKPKVSKVSPGAVKRFVVNYNVAYTTSNGFPLEEWVLNNVSFIPPSKPLLPAVYSGTPISSIIREELGSANMRRTIIEQLEYNQVYEIVMIGNDMQPHPWHFHGYKMDFIDSGSLLPWLETEETDECNQTVHDTGRISEFIDSLPGYNKPREAIGYGDSFMVPGFGYVVLRFKADNPGTWMFHCHISWHMMMGMSMVFSVENEPGKYFIEDPIGFPGTCVVAPNRNVVEEASGDPLLPYQIVTTVVSTLLVIASPIIVYGSISLRRRWKKLKEGYAKVVE